MLTVPTGYTVAPSTPASGSETYRTEAVVNPETDTDTVTLTWSVPAELPAYAIVTLAEDAADEAAASAAAAAADAALVDSYSGPAAIIEDAPFESNNLDFTVGSWRDYDFLYLSVRDSNATDQISRPTTMVSTVELDTQGEVRGPFNNNDELRIESTTGSDVLQLNITGWSGHPTTADVLTIYGVRSGVEAGGGGGGGVGPAGPAGSDGSDGTDGMDGADGATGPAGPAGAAGAAGADGDDGDDGAAGPAATLSDDTPESVTGTVTSAGTSTEASRSDHEHDLVDGAVTQVKLSDGSVHTSKIADASVTRAKLAADARAVTTDAPVSGDGQAGDPITIANQAIGHVKLGSSVGGVNQAAGRITEADGAGNVRWTDKGGGSGSTLSDADPEDVGTTASPGTSTESSRADHVHVGDGTGGGGGGSTDLSDDTPERVAESGDEAGTSTEASRSDHKHQLSAGVERLVEQVPALGIKTNDLRIDDTTRTWVDATDANHGFALFTNAEPVPTNAALEAATYANPLVSVANTTTRYIVARVDIGEHPGNFRLFEEDLPNSGTATVLGSNFRHLHSSTLYDFYGFAIRVQVVRTFTLQEHELPSGNTHYRGGTIAEQAVVDASGFDRILATTDDDAQKIAVAVDDLKVPTDNTLDYNANDELFVNVQDVIEHLQERIRYFTSSTNYSSDAGASVGQAYNTSQYRRLITKVEVNFDPLAGADAFLVRLVELESNNEIKAKLFTSNTRRGPFGAGSGVRAFTFHDAAGDVGVPIDGGIRLGILLSRLEDDSDSAVGALHGSEASGSPNETYDDASDDFDLDNGIVYQHIDPAVGASTHSHDTQIRGNIKIFYTLILDHGNLVGDGNVTAAHIDSGSATENQPLLADGSGGAAFGDSPSGGGGGTTPELTQAQVEDDTDTTFGTVSGERLAQAVAEHETGGAADTDRVVLADATGVSNTAGPHEIALTEAMVVRQLLTFHVVTSGATNPDAIGYFLSDDILALTAEATAPSDAENGLPFTTTNFTQTSITSQGGNYFVYRKDDSTLWVRPTRLAAHSLTITATPLGGGAGTSEQQSGSGVLTRVNIHQPPSDPFELTTTGTGSALSVGNENQIFFTAVEKARVERCVIILRIDDTFNIKADISKEEMDRLPDITELRPDPIVGTDESGVIYLSGRTQISADSREPQLPNPTWAYIDFRRLASRYGICIGFTDDSTGLRWRSLRTYCNSDVGIAIVSSGMYHV